MQLPRMTFIRRRFPAEGQQAVLAELAGRDGIEVVVETDDLFSPWLEMSDKSYASYPSK